MGYIQDETVPLHAIEVLATVEARNFAGEDRVSFEAATD